MKTRAMTCAFVLVTGLASAGSALAQSASPTTPSNTPNDATATQPNRALPAGQMAPAPTATPSTGTTPPATHNSGTMSSGKKHSNEMPKRPREANDNVPRTPAAGATPPPGYPNSGGSK